MQIEYMKNSLEPIKDIIVGFLNLNSKTENRKDFVLSFQPDVYRFEIKGVYSERFEIKNVSTEKARAINSLFIEVSEGDKKIVLSGDPESNSIVFDGDIESDTPIFENVVFPSSVQKEFFILAIVFSTELLAKVFGFRSIQLVTLKNSTLKDVIPIFEKSGFKVENKEPFILHITLPVSNPVAC